VNVEDQEAEMHVSVSGGWEGSWPGKNSTQNTVAIIRCQKSVYVQPCHPFASSKQR